MFLLTSPSEGVSIATLEAMSAGLPAVVTDVGDQRDIVEPEKTGRLLELHQPRSSAEVIDALLGDEAKRQQMSRAARELILGRASVQAIARKWDEMFGNDGEPL
jgi:glycosyltransferase involved in cell wall biosynthesis